MKTPVIPILFLSVALLASCDSTEMTSPVVVFDALTPPIYKFKVTLDASGSFSTEEGDWLEYRWDLNGDHLAWETDWSNNPVITLQFPYEHNGYIGLQARDQNGNITELYQGFYTNVNYGIIRPNTDLEIDFRTINYQFSFPDHHWSWMWAYDNIQLPGSAGWYNFPASSDRALYGTLMPWPVANNLEEDYRLPSKADWQKMIDFCGGAALAGFNLQVKAEHGLQLTLPGLVTAGQLREHGKTGYYWTGDEADEDSAWALKITEGSDEAEFVILDKSSLASIRLMIEFINYR